MFVPVSPVAPAAPSGGLRRAAQQINDNARWESGFSWRPERCPQAETFDPCAGDVSEVQTLTITGGPTGGTWTATWGGQTTGNVAFNATGVTFQAALIALSNLNPGDVTVSGGAGGPYVVTFAPQLGNVGPITTNGAGLTGGTAPAVNVVQTAQGSNVYGQLHGDGYDGLAYYRPVGFRVERTCSTMGGRDHVETSDVRAQADAITSYEMARELWTGQRSEASPYDIPGGSADVNASLASPDATVIPGGFTPLDGLGVLEEEARQGNLGLDLMIHVPLQVLAHLAQHLVRVGALLYTQGGAQVVADAGYDGTAPDGTVEEDRRWIYATGPVSTRLSEIVVNEFVNQRTNRRTVVAERLFAAYFDPCTHYGLAVVVPTPAADPA